MWDTLLKPAVTIATAPEKRQASTLGPPQLFVLVSPFALAFSIPGTPLLLVLGEPRSIFALSEMV